MTHTATPARLKRRPRKKTRTRTRSSPTVAASRPAKLPVGAARRPATNARSTVMERLSSGTVLITLTAFDLGTSFGATGEVLVQKFAPSELSFVETRSLTREEMMGGLAALRAKAMEVLLERIDRERTYQADFDRFLNDLARKHKGDVLTPHDVRRFWEKWT